VPEKSPAELQRVEFFGAEVAADPAVTWKPSGLGIKILAPGDGLVPQLSDNIRINYSGRLLVGTVFNETAPGKPLEAKLNDMIPGMKTGIAALKPGGRAILYVPPSLGYGSSRVGKIPPVSGLIFEVELLAVTP
jgi:FKBP-type peptidyl-prolyl cis-trans isomerase